MDHMGRQLFPNIPSGCGISPVRVKSEETPYAAFGRDVSKTPHRTERTGLRFSFILRDMGMRRFRIAYGSHGTHTDRMGRIRIAWETWGVGAFPKIPSAPVIF